MWWYNKTVSIKQIVRKPIVRLMLHHHYKYIASLHMEYGLHNTLYTIQTIPYTVYPIHYTLHTISYTLYPTHYILLETIPYRPYLKHYTLHILPYTLYPLLYYLFVTLMCSCIYGWFQCCAMHRGRSMVFQLTSLHVTARHCTALHWTTPKSEYRC